MHYTFSSLLTAYCRLTAICQTPLQVPQAPSEALDTAAGQLSLIAKHAASWSSNQISIREDSRCTPEKLIVRRRWDDLSRGERIAYTDAVRCLQTKPNHIPQAQAPGARSRYDDFIVTHIDQAWNNHGTGSFLSWHRYLVWTYEQALRNECGYTGAQPYWDWSETATTGLRSSPIFDGTATSMSGNGDFDPAQPDRVSSTYQGSRGQTIPSGTGGGCVTDGPFKHMVANLGPLVPSSDDNATTRLDHNPRCLKRNFRDSLNRDYANASSIAHLLLNSKTISEFQANLQVFHLPGLFGAHDANHWTIGGDMSDFLAANVDPVFYPHHAMLDRVWWMWQSLDPSTRAANASAVSGPRSLIGSPSGNVSLSDIIDLQYAGGRDGVAAKIEEVLNPVSGPFCYIYL